MDQTTYILFGFVMVSFIFSPTGSAHSRYPARKIQKNNSQNRQPFAPCPPRASSDVAAPVRKLVGIRNVFLGTELVDIAEYDLQIYEENPDDHQHHGANWTPNAKKIEGTVVGELPIRKDLTLIIGSISGSG